MAARADPLARYNEKRDFARTPEPAGEVAESGRSIFMVQKHAARRLHWDLRLELGGVLLSWAVTKGPSADPQDKRLAVRTEDHPLSYATFEGTIPRGGYGGGTVMLWDRGTWEPDQRKDPVKTLEEGHLHFTLHGERMKGEWILVRLKPRKGERTENWLLRKVADDHVGGDLAEEYLTSVATGRAMEEIAKGETAPTMERAAALPAFRPVQLATLVDEPPTGNDWVHEMKFDGYRLLVAVAGDEVVAWTRNENRFAPSSLAPVAEQLKRIAAGSALIDGEICALDDTGRPNFSRLKNSLKEGSAPLDFFAFDLLEADGEDLSALPLTARKFRLQSVLAPCKPPVHLTDHVRGEGEKVLQALCAGGYEGIISKRADGKYQGRRTQGWLKIKCIRRQEFVIGGWSRSEKGRGFASLLLGYYEGERLIYAGRVGTGFDMAMIDELTERMAGLKTAGPAFESVPREARRGVTWVNPELVAEVAYTEFTPDGHLRHPSFLGLREDKRPGEVVLETPQAPPPAAQPDPPAAKPKPTRKSGGANRHGIAITNPDRVLFPEAGVTKAQLVGYYETVADLILPQIARRPLSLVRCPQGRGKHCFFQKHDSGGFGEAMRTIDLHETTSEGKARQPYLYVEDLGGVVAAVQMGTLELHIWGSRVPEEEQPDRLVFDLDPDEGLGWKDVVGAAFEMRERLQAQGLESWPMLTGGKGVHVVVPIAPEREWAAVKAWCKAFADAAAAEQPERYTAVLSKKARKGRIFIDYLRNGRGATAIAPYSTRARAGAPVAAPVSWNELRDIDSGAQFRVEHSAELVKRGRSKALNGWATSDQRLPE